MARRGLGMGLVLAMLFELAAAALPVVLQPDDPAFTPGEQGALVEAVSLLDRDLTEELPMPPDRLVRSGWDDRAFAAYAAGRLTELGYPSLAAEASGGTEALRVWVLAGVSVGDRLAYVPVVTSPSAPGAGDSRLGVIAWASGSMTRFDPVYLAFDLVVDPALADPPAVSILPPRGVVMRGEKTAFLSSSRDSGGRIIARVWDFGDGEIVVGSSLSVWHTYQETGAYAVTLTVYDDRGAYAADHVEVEVLDEDPDCGCHAGKKSDF